MKIILKMLRYISRPVTVKPLTVTNNASLALFYPFAHVYMDGNAHKSFIVKV